ncbi:hypothetical protein P7C70_g2965, partial [Phenoliferia sp. Uapishka_3]
MRRALMFAAHSDCDPESSTAPPGFRGQERQKVSVDCNRIEREVRPKDVFLRRVMDDLQRDNALLRAQLAATGRSGDARSATSETQREPPERAHKRQAVEEHSPPSHYQSAAPSRLSFSPNTVASQNERKLRAKVLQQHASRSSDGGRESVQKPPASRSADFSREPTSAQRVGFSNASEHLQERSDRDGGGSSEASWRQPPESLYYQERRNRAPVPPLSPPPSPQIQLSRQPRSMPPPSAPFHSTYVNPGNFSFDDRREQVYDQPEGPLLSNSYVDTTRFTTPSPLGPRAGRPSFSHGPTGGFASSGVAATPHRLPFRAQVGTPRPTLNEFYYQPGAARSY